MPDSKVLAETDPTISCHSKPQLTIKETQKKATSCKMSLEGKSGWQNEALVE